MKQLVFLGGTAGNNQWRDGFIQALIERGVPADVLFNPAVPPGQWDEAGQAKEDEAKAHHTAMLFYLADPKEAGNPISTYSIFEAQAALYDHPETTVVVFDKTGMNGHPLKIMNKVEEQLRKRFPQGRIFSTPSEAINWLAERFGARENAAPFSAHP
jgi:hypothetical protein